MAELVIIGIILLAALVFRVIRIRKTSSPVRCLQCGRRLRLRSRQGKTSIYSCRKHANVSIDRRK